MLPPVKLWFCDFGKPGAETLRSRLFRIMSKRFNIVLDADAPDFLLYSCFGAEFAKYSCPRIFYTGENLRPNFSECDFALSFDADVPGKNHRLPYYALDDLSFLRAPRTADISGKTCFCNFIYGNSKCDERNSFFRLLSEYKRVDAAGALFNNMPRLPVDSDDNRRAKTEFMRPYKFTIAFENASAPGYLTEKLIDAWAAGTVPIYWGSPSAAKEFNADAFINCHDFPDFNSVVRHVMEVDADGEKYARYAAAPPLKNGKLPPAASWTRLLDFLEYAFANPPQNPASASRHSQIIRHTPRFIHKRIIRAGRKR